MCYEVVCCDYTYICTYNSSISSIYIGLGHTYIMYFLHCCLCSTIRAMSYREQAELRNRHVMEQYKALLRQQQTSGSPTTPISNEARLSMLRRLEENLSVARIREENVSSLQGWMGWGCFHTLFYSFASMRSNTLMMYVQARNNTSTLISDLRVNNVVWVVKWPYKGRSLQVVENVDVSLCFTICLTLAAYRLPDVWGRRKRGTERRVPSKTFLEYEWTYLYSVLLIELSLRSRTVRCLWMSSVIMSPVLNMERYQYFLGVGSVVLILIYHNIHM